MDFKMLPYGHLGGKAPWQRLGICPPEALRSSLGNKAGVNHLMMPYPT
jgi:hypothetical protein